MHSKIHKNISHAASDCVLSICRAMSAKLRLLQFCERGSVGRQRVGVQLQGGRVVDVTAVNSSIPTDMRTFLQDFQANSAAAEKYGILHALQ